MSLHRVYILKFFACVIAFATSNATAFAADAGSAMDEQTRPKIGLALSGGGARGAAHIGVLKVLEENNIPIDYIAGTSMGSIVGGLYATGMSPDEILDAIESIDWDGVFDDLPAREERSFRRKRDDDFYLVKAKPGIDKDGLKLPAGVVQGQKINLALARFTRHVARIKSFDDYAIPYRAVASDIVTGEAVVLDSGNLAHAIRASMSVPAAFAPMIIDGHQLVDGGIANNLPIDVVRSMGADIVIAVDISTPLLTEEQVNSVLSITVQLTGILTRRNAEAQIATLTDDDVLLIPDLGDITSADFVRAAEAIPTGRTAAEANIASLRRYSLPADDYAEYRAGLEHFEYTSPVIDFVRFDNQSRFDDSALAYRVYNTKVGEPFSLENVERDVGRIYGLELFSNVGYDIVEEDGQTGLEFHINERPWGPTYLQIGAEYDSNNDGDNIFNLGGSLLFTGLNASRGEVRLGAQIGEEPGLLVDYHQPFGDKAMWFANALATTGDRVITIYEDDVAISNYEVSESLIEASLGRELGTWGEVRGGIRYADGDADVRTGNPDDNPEIPFERGEFFTRFFADEFDSSNFPTSGYLAKVEWTGSRDGLGADTDFDQIGVTGTIAKSWGKHTLVSSIRYHSTISGTAPIQSLFRAGGFLNLSGFNSNELSGQHYARAAGVYYQRLGHSAFLPLYAGVSLEVGNVFQNRDDIGLSDSIYAGSLFLGADSFIGPVYLAYGNAEGGNSAFYIYLGRGF
ncbi:MAG: patatin-like phospholipase family protein [Woeseiaceae bacterium]